MLGELADVIGKANHISFIILFDRHPEEHSGHKPEIATKELLKLKHLKIFFTRP